MGDYFESTEVAFGFLREDSIFINMLKISSDAQPQMWI